MRKTQTAIASILIAALLILGACAPKAAPAPTAPPVIEITAEELFWAYRANELAAKEKYKDKAVRVTGVVDSVGKDELGNPYVALVDGGPSGEWSVQCLFAKEDEPELAQLTKGQTVTIEGTVVGYRVRIKVLVKDSTLVR